MRYFTPEWWSSGCADTSRINAYRDHFESIIGALPPSILEFEERHTLHDSRLEAVVANYVDRSLTLRLSGWNRAFSQQVRYNLLFLDVASFEQNLPSGRDVESELGDLGYWEYAIEAQGIELRTLFASGAQFRVVFANARFTLQPPT